MVNQIYVNLPVKNLKRSMEFFSKLGFEYNMKFTNDSAACMIMGKDIFAMLLDENFFQTFTDKTIIDARKNIEVITCFSVDSKEQVETLIDKAKKAGGLSPRPPTDYGFMYSRSFEDLDGHVWEVVSYSGEEQPK
ncbi:VOC family protein [Bdellovibrio bacteriovorus]|uniref:VOC family protein n=1 Tax=Bdellovibrio bacteriovorus TaxID=959 RepID=UPI003D07E8D9